jgi:UDP:flavonoid glycosyltransferase YjiC (YdhE family)
MGDTRMTSPIAKSRKKVLLAPLDWGLGHATRSLTLAHALEALGHEVCIASCGGALNLLRQALPGRAYWELPDYRIDYPKTRQGFAISLLRQAPKVRKAIREEHEWLLRHAPRAGFEVILSDGRYGLWHKSIPSVLISHQIALMPPQHFPLKALAMQVTEALNRRYLRRFSEVWIPDIEHAPGLSGRLGHPGKALPHARYIGPLNRFAWEAKEREGDKSEDDIQVRPTDVASIDILAIVSGPEPQRTLFENALRIQLESLPGTRVLVQGLPGVSREADQGNHAEYRPRPGSLTVWPHVPGSILLPLLRQAKAVISRSGYTTVMELACLDIKPVLMVATPGQPEQEYLAEMLGAGGYVLTQRQEDLQLSAALPHLGGLKGLRRVLRKGDPNLPVDQAAPGLTREGMLGFLRQHPFLA